MKTISRNRLKALIDSDASLHLIEVLGADQFNEFHLPDAENVPLKDDFEEKMKKLVPDKSATIVVYCKDEDCPASSKAAKRLEKLGYTDVLDYEPGKDDWKKAGLPIEAPSGASRS